jgi:transporter family-2 protein
MTISRTLAIVLTVSAGALTATQANVNGRLGRGVGTMQAATISFGVGLVVIVALTLIFGGGFGPIAKAASLPRWTLVGGAMGAAIVVISLVSVRVLGTGGLTAAMISGQLTLAVVIDRFNLFGFGYHALDATRIAGVVLLAAGSWLILRH